MSAFIFGNLSVKVENRSAASLRCTDDLLTYQHRNQNDELDSHASGKRKHTSQSGDIFKKQNTGVDISDICRKGSYNTKASAGPSRLNALGWSELSKEEPKYSPAGRAHKEKYVRLRIRQKERLCRRKRSLTEPSTQSTPQLPRVSETRHPQTLPMFLESHTKVLNRFIKAGFALRNQQQMWSEEELDCLWVGVRRHGLGNWESMLRDPRLRFSKFKTAADLEARWALEELKAIE